MKKRFKKYILPHPGNDFRPYLLRIGGLLFVVIFVAGSFFASNVHRLLLKGSDLLASILPAVLVDLANSDRAGSQLAYLKINPKLEEAAMMKANDMANKGYFAHNSPGGESPWYWIKEAGYNFVYAGENLAVNFDDSDAVNTAWMNSPGHKANIMSGNFTEVGIATAKGVYQGKQTIFVVQMFGSPAMENPMKITEKSLTPISEDKKFIAVKDTDAIPVVQSVSSTTVLGAVSYSSQTEKLLSSPTKLLKLVYFLVALLLTTAFLTVFFVKHKHKLRHTIYILILLLLAITLLLSYQYFVSKNIQLAEISFVV